MNDEYKVTVRIDGPGGECWEALTWIDRPDWKLMMKEVKKMNEDPEIEAPWDPAAEIAYGMIREGILAMRKKGEIDDD